MNGIPATPVRALALAIVLGNASASAQVRIRVGEVVLLPNTADQVVEFKVSNSSRTNILVEGFELNVQVGDGGMIVGGIDVGPAITRVDLVTGTLFQANSIGTRDASGRPQGEHPMLGLYSTVTAASTVSIPAGSTTRLARVTFDTRALESGRWPLAFGLTANGSSRYVNLAAGGLGAADQIVPLIQDGFLKIAEDFQPMDPAPELRLSFQWDVEGRIIFAAPIEIGTGIGLQSAPTVDSVVWTDVPFEVVGSESGVQYAIVPGDSNAPMRFYRLAKKSQP